MQVKFSTRLLSICIVISFISLCFGPLCTNMFFAYAVSDGSSSFYEETILDNCDSTNGWVALAEGEVSQLSTDVEEGTGAITLSNATSSIMNVMNRISDTPINMQSITDSGSNALQFWIKIEDTTAVNLIRIDLGSEQGIGMDGEFNWSHGKAWQFPASRFKSGVWTKITIRASDSNVFYEWNQTGAIDFSTIRYISVQAKTNQPKLAVVHVDNIALVGASSKYAIDDCDTINGWTSSSGSIGASSTSEDGTGSIKSFNGEPNATNAISKTFSNSMNMLPLTRDKDKELSLWVKIDNLAAVDYIRIDLFSEQGLNADGSVNWENGYGKAWKFPASDFVEGEWTNITISKANTDVFHEWGVIDYSKIKYISVQTNTVANGLSVICVDDIAFVDYTETETEVTSMIDNCDSSATWVSDSGSALQVTVDVQEGSGAVSLSNNVANDVNVMHNTLSKSVDMSSITSSGTNALQFWIKVADVSTIEFIRIDLGSELCIGADGKFNSTHGKAWNFPASKFVSNEWTQITIRAEDTNINYDWGNIDYSKIKYIAIHTKTVSPGLADVCVDNIALVEYTPPVSTETINDNCDTKDNWESTCGSSQIVTADVKEGTGAIQMSGAPETELSMRRIFTQTADMSGMGVKGSKALQFWVKVADVASINNVGIDIADINGIVGTNLNWTHLKRWLIPSDKLKSGEWVKIQLTDFDDTTFNPWNNSLDYSKIKYIGFKIPVSSSFTQADIYIDDMQYTDYEAPATDPNGPTMQDGAVLISGFEPGEVTNSGGFIVDQNEKHSGNGSLKVSFGPIGEGNYAAPSWSSRISPVNLGNMIMYGGTLEFWVKISDPSRINTGNNSEPPFRIQLGGDEGPKTYLNCRAWDLKPADNNVTANQWCKISVDFAKPTVDTMNPNTFIESEDGRDYNFYNLKFIQMIVTATAGSAPLTFWIDDLTAVPNFVPPSGGDGEIRIDNPDYTKPVVNNKSVAAVLNYKVVVAKNTTVGELVSSLSLHDGYEIKIFDSDGNQVDNTVVLKTGMWMIVFYQDVDVGTYYLEVGTPTNVTMISDEPVGKRLDTIAVNNNIIDDSSTDDSSTDDSTSENPQTGDNSFLFEILITIFLSAGAILVLCKKRVVKA